jgi:hypothetical protein
VVVSVTVSAAIFFTVIELIRRNRLKERYALLWLFSSLVLLLFSVSRNLLHFMSQVSGIAYPPSLIFLLGFLFLIVINVHFSTVISKLSDENKTLAQEVALLREVLEKRAPLE